MDVTPRNLQVLKVAAGDVFTCEMRSLDGSKLEASGETTADKYNLLLIPHVPIRRSGALVTVRPKRRGPRFRRLFGSGNRAAGGPAAGRRPHPAAGREAPGPTGVAGAGETRPARVRIPAEPGWRASRSG